MRMGHGTAHRAPIRSSLRKKEVIVKEKFNLSQQGSSSGKITEMINKEERPNAHNSTNSRRDANGVDDNSEGHRT